MDHLTEYFASFRSNIIGQDHDYTFESGKKPILYADWAASGRLYRPIENYMTEVLGPFYANTHTETTLTGTTMTHAYHQARDIVKKHVNASADDRVLFPGSGMTRAINKLQRILGLKVPEQHKHAIKLSGNDRPLVIITHMEHHSNQTCWVECLCDLRIIREDSEGLPDLNHLREILQANKDRKQIIGSFTACSNVTGIVTPYHEMAEIVHEFGGVCFVDFAASAPYVEINMHPEKAAQRLDAVFFSPHKFLGGPGSAGVVVFHKSLYQNTIPDQPGGGTVLWTNPWGEHHYFDDIEVREDGGTPGALQSIKAALSMLLKDEMGVANILEREHSLTNRLMDHLENIPGVTMLETNQRQRIGFISFYIRGIHHNLIVRLLNDKFGIQSRGGCSCAGTYGHVLLKIDYHESHRITDQIDHGDLSEKPGWVRISLHPTMLDEEMDYIGESVKAVVKNYANWKENYRFDKYAGDFIPNHQTGHDLDIRQLFSLKTT